MDPVTEIERRLPPVDRERLALKAWESLANDPSAMSDLDVDPHGIEMATNRDAELDQSEFRRRTGGGE